MAIRFRLLTEADVKAVVTMDDLIETMASALQRFSTGRVTQPVRTVIPVEANDSFFGTMPALVRADGNRAAALGAKLAARDKTVICCVGDGAYIFGAPTAAHWVARAYDLPVLFVVYNNRAWNAVKRAVNSVAPDGWATRTGMVLSDLDPAPEYEMICQSCGGYGERVDDPADLPAALARAAHSVKVDRRQAVVNVVCKKPR